jgi:rhamnose utilization protein RhaD (predicted bifunctional aldolase and dehydrogenase)
MSLEKLIALSNRYGADPEYVIAGGGNTSWKNDLYMYVKGSGTELATIEAEGFVKVNLSTLDQIWSRTYSEDTDKREEEVLADLMASRYPSEGSKRPSVETLLHALLPFNYVVHTHPALVNGITCSRNGAEAVRTLFGDSAIWVPITNPGYILAREVKDEIEEHMAGGNDFPQMIFLQNHGVFVSANTVDEIDSIYKEMFSAIKKAIKDFPDTDELPVEDGAESSVEKSASSVLGDGLVVKAFANRNILSMSESKEAFAPLELAMTPDHIVYYGFKPVYAESLNALGDALSLFVRENGMNPRLAVVKGVGAFAINSSDSLTDKSRMLFLDDVKIAVYTESFGGYQFMPRDQIDFIRNWEVEKYRVSQSK